MGRDLGRVKISPQDPNSLQERQLAPNELGVFYYRRPADGQIVPVVPGIDPNGNHRYETSTRELVLVLTTGDEIRIFIPVKLDEGDGAVDVTPPATVSDLAYTFTAGGSPSLTWTDPPDNDLASVGVYRDGVLLTTVPAGQGSFIDSSVAEQTTYSYDVRGVDLSDNEGDASNVVTLTTPDKTAPALPSNLSIQSGDAQAVLSWINPDDADLDSIRVFVGQTPTPTTEDQVLDASSLIGLAQNATITGLTNGLTYYVRLKAVDTSGNETAYTPAVQVTPDAVASVNITAPANNALLTEGNIALVEASVSTSGSLDTVEAHYHDGSSWVSMGLMNSLGNGNFSLGWNVVPDATQIRVTATNTGGTAATDAINIVTVPNEPPAVTLSPVANIEQGNPLEATFTASDSDGIIASTFAEVETGGATTPADSITQLAGGGYKAVWNGLAAATYTVRVGATDDDGATTTETASVTVTTNRAPRFSSSPVTSVTEGEAYSYAVIGSDPDGDPVSLAMTAGPGWLTFTDNGDGTATLAGTAPYVSGGTDYGIVLEITDGELTAEQRFTLTVQEMAGIPDFTVAASPSTIDEGQTSTFSISLADSGYEVTYLIDGAKVNFDPVTDEAGGYTLTQVWGDPDVYSPVTARVKRVSDGTVKDSSNSVTLTVNEVAPENPSGLAASYVYDQSLTPDPDTPQNLTATAQDSQAVLTWNAVAGVDGYNIYYDTDSGEPYANVLQVTTADVTNNGDGTVSYTVTGLQNGTTYYFAVTSYVDS